MKKMVLGIATVAMLLVVAAVPARAQGAAIAKVPVRFIVNGRVLPSGTYRFTKAEADGSALMISDVTGRVAPVIFPTTPFSGPLAEGAVRVELKNYRGLYFLSTVAIAGETVREVALSAPEMDRTLARLNLLEPEPALGASPR